MTGAWHLMVHGFAFVEEDVQGGPRGATQFGVLNWAMFMATHEVAAGRFQARTMLSGEPASSDRAATRSCCSRARLTRIDAP